MRDDDTPYDWREDAKCKGMHGKDPHDPFFPTKGGNALIVARMAKNVCNGLDGFSTCPVRQECLLFAMDGNERFGIWGGLSEKQRQSLRKKPRSRWKPPNVRRLVADAARLERSRNLQRQAKQKRAS